MKRCSCGVCHDCGRPNDAQPGHECKTRGVHLVQRKTGPQVLATQLVRELGLGTDEEAEAFGLRFPDGPFEPHEETWARVVQAAHRKELRQNDQRWRVSN